MFTSHHIHVGKKRINKKPQNQQRGNVIYGDNRLKRIKVVMRIELEFNFNFSGSTRSLKIVYQPDTNHRLKRHLSDQAIPLHDIHPGTLAGSEDQEYIIIKNPNYCPRPRVNSNFKDLNNISSHDRKFKQKPSVHWNPVTHVLQGSVATIDERDDVSSTTSGSYTVELEDMTSREYTVV